MDNNEKLPATWQPLHEAGRRALDIIIKQMEAQKSQQTEKQRERIYG
jgi:hypothetical protein